MSDELSETLEEAAMPVTILALAKHRGLKTTLDDSSSGEDFAAVGLAILGGCEICGASIAAYNAYPSKSGCWRCEDCIGDTGWTDVCEANRAIFGDEPEAERPKRIGGLNGPQWVTVRDLAKRMRQEIARIGHSQFVDTGDLSCIELQAETNAMTIYGPEWESR